MMACWPALAHTLGTHKYIGFPRETSNWAILVNVTLFFLLLFVSRSHYIDRNSCVTILLHVFPTNATFSYVGTLPIALKKQACVQCLLSFIAQHNVNKLYENFYSQQPQSRSLAAHIILTFLFFSCYISLCRPQVLG